MATQIHNAIAACPIYAPTRPSNPKQPLTPHEIPSCLWQKLATDLFTWNEGSFLVTVDYSSRFFKVDELTTMTSAAVIRKLFSHFARQGIPEVVVSDNSPQFASEGFAAFAASWDFQHVTSSPEYPQSNGLAEKIVQTAKNILSRAKAEGSNPCLALLEYCSSIGQPGIPSAVTEGQTTPIHSAICCQTPATHDRHAHQLPPLQPGDKIHVQLSKRGK